MTDDRNQDFLPQEPDGYTLDDLRRFLDKTDKTGAELARVCAPYTVTLDKAYLDEVVERVVRLTHAKSQIPILKSSVRTMFSEAAAAWQQRRANENRPVGSDQAKATYEKFRETYIKVRTMPGQVIDLRGDGDSAILSLRSRDLEDHASNTIAEHKITATGGLVPRTFFEKWEKDPERREFERLVIDRPGVTPAGCYNLFLGYAIEPKQGVWATLKEYLRDTLCRGNEEHYQYLLKWICFKIQNPGVPPEILVQIIGGQGIGKTTLFILLEAIFGKKFAMLFDNPDAVDDSFNSQVAFRAVTAYDEAFYHKSNKSRNKIKGMVSGARVNVNTKNIPKFRQENYQGIIMFSNGAAAVGLDHDDRRQLVLRPSAEHANDDSYFTRLYAAIHGEELQAFLYDALQAELPDRLLLPPKTKARRDAIAESASSGEDFILDLLQKGNSFHFGYPVIPIDDKRAEKKAKDPNPWPLGAIAINKEELLEQYRDFMKERHRQEAPLSDRQFLRSIQSLLGEDCLFHTKEDDAEVECGKSQKKKSWRDGRWQNVPGEGAKYFWYMRKLNDCRAQYEKKVGEIVWDTVYDDDGNPVVIDDAVRPEAIQAMYDDG